MKVVCTQEKLSLGLNIVSRSIGKTGNLPILNNILIQAKKEGIYLLSTNLETGIKYLVTGKVEKEGEFTVPARTFNDYISFLKDKIEIEQNDNFLTIKSGNNLAKINGQPANEFPLFPKIEGEKKIVLRKEILLKIIKYVSFASSINETRPELTGVLFKINPEKKQAFFVATDSYRLAEYRFDIDEDYQEPLFFIIPTKTLIELARIINLLKTNEEKIEVFINETQVLFVYENLELISRLIDGVFPDYEQIIPNNFLTEIKVNRLDLISAIKATSLFSRSGIYDVNLETISENELQVKGSNSQIGENQTIINAQITGPKCKISFNYNYLLEGLNVLEGENIVLKIIDSDNPCLLADLGEKNYLYLIMPIRDEA